MYNQVEAPLPSGSQRVAKFLPLGRERLPFHPLPPHVAGRFMERTGSLSPHLATAYRARPLLQPDSNILMKMEET